MLPCSLALARWSAGFAARAVALVLPAPPATAQARPIDNACPDDGRVPDPGFTDLSPTRAEAIECIAAYGVAAGRTPALFAPSANVTRGRMAAFLLRGLDVAGVDLPDPVAEDHFPDTARTPREQSIRILAAFDPPVVSAPGPTRASGVARWHR